MIHVALFVLALILAVPTVLALEMGKYGHALILLFLYMFWVIGVGVEREMERKHKVEK